MARVLVAMSGGVDSSVAAKLLIDAGHEVAGVTLKLFSDEDIVSAESCGRTCCALSDVEDARAVAHRLGIDHFVFNFREVFAERVVSRFVSSYLAGLTPNPCVDCNRFVKFGALLERARVLGYDYLATGHYARVSSDGATGRRLLLRGLDASKDQSYVLYALTQEELAHTLFPVGELSKDQVRRVAESAGLVNARKPDSQDICFVPGGDYGAFIEKAAPGSLAPGDFVDLRGNPIGRHRGVARYTIGQRRGIAVSFGKPMYVAAKDARANTVTLAEDQDLLADSLVAVDLNYISIAEPAGPVEVTAKIRYNQRDRPARVEPLPGGGAIVRFPTPERAIAPGQAVVFYDGETVVGGGTILAPGDQPPASSLADSCEKTMS